MKSLVLSIVFYIICISNMAGQLQIGDTIPSISLTNANNEIINLSSFKGKVVLIDFWASWCAPCRKANKKLVKIHKDYQDSTLQIIGISLDVDPIKWQNAIAKDKILYTQLIDAKGFDAMSAIKFGVEALPATYLFDENGRLLAINPSENTISEFLKHLK